MFARTERLLLRPSWPEDAAEIHQAIADEGIVRNLAHAPWPYTAEHAASYAAQGHDPLYPDFLLMLRTRGAPRLIGACGLGKYGGQAELAYWVARPYWGLGFATEASRAVVQIAQAIGHEKLIATHFIDNPASGKILRKLGFQTTGKSVQRHSIARGETVECALYEKSLENAELQHVAMPSAPAFTIREQFERLHAA